MTSILIPLEAQNLIAKNAAGSASRVRNKRIASESKTVTFPKYLRSMCDLSIRNSSRSMRILEVKDRAMKGIANVAMAKVTIVAVVSKAAQIAITSDSNMK